MAVEIQEDRIEVTGGMAWAWGVVPLVFCGCSVCSGRASVGAWVSAGFDGREAPFLMKPLTLMEFSIRSTSELMLDSSNAPLLGGKPFDVLEAVAGIAPVSLVWDASFPF